MRHIGLRLNYTLLRSEDKSEILLVGRSCRPALAEELACIRSLGVNPSDGFNFGALSGERSKTHHCIKLLKFLALF